MPKCASHTTTGARSPGHERFPFSTILDVPLITASEYIQQFSMTQPITFVYLSEEDGAPEVDRVEDREGFMIKHSRMLAAGPE